MSPPSQRTGRRRVDWSDAERASALSGEPIVDKNRTDGAAKEITGAAKEVLGKVTGNIGKQAEGVAEKTLGKAQRKIGEAADHARDEVRKAP
jgi:uncharacterized protein YjbJ (UPF0337 family)